MYQCQRYTDGFQGQHVDCGRCPPKRLVSAYTGVRKIMLGSTVAIQRDVAGFLTSIPFRTLCPTPKAMRTGTGVDKGSFQSVRPIHPTEHRVITVREGARLQGFPDKHLFHPTIWHSFRMIGNSVSPIMAEVVLNVVRDALNEISTSSKNQMEKPLTSCLVT